MTTLALEKAVTLVDSRVTRAQQGDMDAFNELVRETERVVFSICLRITGDRARAEDAAQDTYIAAWRNIGKVSADRFRPWLCRIAVNTSKSQLRKRQYRVETTLDCAATAEAPGPTPEQASLRRALRDEVAQALMQIPEDQRQAVVLWHQAGLNYQEIAEATRSSLGTVKSRLFRGRRHLSRVLSPQLLATDA